MPLIIAVLIIIVAYLACRDQTKKNSNDIKQKAVYMRKTNARLQQQLLDKHMKCGMSFDKAVELSDSEITKLGFEPIACEVKTRGDGKISYSSEISFELNSKLVQQRWEECIRWDVFHPDEPKPDVLTDDIIYKDFPETIFQYNTEVKNHMFMLGLIKVGSSVCHSTYGTCVVVAYKYGSSKLPTKYVIRSVKTDMLYEVSTQNSGLTKL